MNYTKAQERSSILFVLIGTILFSSKVILAKWAYQYDATPLALLWIRMLSAAPFYLIIGLIASHNSKTHISIKDKGIIIFLGLIGYYISSLLDFTGMQYISSGLERMLLYLYPTFVILISVGVLRQKITGEIIVSLLLSYIGILLMFYSDLDFNKPEQIKGALFVFIAAFSFAIFLIVGGRLINRVGTIRYTSYAMLTSAAALSGHYTVINGLDFSSISTEVWVLGSVIGAFCTVFPSFMINRGLAVLGPQRVSIYSAIGPVSVLFMGALFYGESITFAKISGALLVVMGGVILSFKGKISSSFEKLRFIR